MNPNPFQIIAAAVVTVAIGFCISALIIGKQKEDRNEALEKAYIKKILATDFHCRYFVVVDQEGWIQMRGCECDPGYSCNVSKP